MIRVVTDSTANLPTALIQENNIVVVPLKVQMGSDTYSEGIDLSPEEFFRRLPTANPLPTTSQPSPLEFEEAYQQILGQGDEVVSLHLSSDLSGTFNSARNGAMSTDEVRISVVDTRTISAGLGLLVLAATEMAKAGKSRAAIADEIEAMSKQGQLLFTLDTLEYLKRGGRINSVQAAIGGLLRVKPTLILKDGKLEAGERARTRRKALEYLVEKQSSHFGKKPVWVGIAEALATDMPELEQMARDRLNVQKLIHCNIGPVIATHTGPNTLGIAALPAPTI